MKKDPESLLRRASEEIIKAIASNEPAASEVHAELSIRYSAKAAEALSDAVDSDLPGEQVAER